MASKEICPQQQSRRDHDRQQRETETPEERRLDRLKEYRKRKRKSETQEDVYIKALKESTTTATMAQVGR